MPEILQGRYQLEDTLGQGGMGITYKATDLRTLQTVAVKQLHLSRLKDWKALELFEREAAILQQLHHPRLPAYRDYFSIETASDAQFCLVQDYIAGKTLKQVIEEGWRGSEKEIFDIFRQLVGILAYLHGLRPPVIHRDLNPKNIICAPAKKAGASPFDVYLVDFGAVQDQIRTTTLGSSTMIGTFGYVPLEQFNGRAVPASDYYALGATLLFMLSHRHPTEFETADLKIDFRAAVNASPTMLRLLDGLLEPSPEKRLDSPQEIKALLEQKAAPQPVKSLAHATPQPPQPALSLPYGSKIRKIERDALHIDIEIPGQFRAGSLGMLGFSAFWLTFVTVWTIGAASGSIFFALFSIPFWLVGIGMASAALYGVFGRTKLRLTPESVEITYAFAAFHHTRRVPTVAIDKIEQAVRYTQNDQPVQGVNIYAGAQTLKLGSNLAPGEQQWLINELEAFVERIR